MAKKKAVMRLLIVDDYELARNGLLFGFKGDDRFEIVGQAENGEEALALAEQELPDLVLMDIAMPVMDGVDATHALKIKFPNMKIIILTSRQEEEEVYAAMGAGADAYCMKDVNTERLMQTIEMVIEGGFWLDPAIAKLVMNALRPKLPQSGRFGSNKQRYRLELTDREKEVLELMAKGKNNKEIGLILNVSVHTAKAHVSSIMQKLSVDDRTEAAIKGLREGLIRQN